MTAFGSNAALVIFALYGLGVFILGWYAHRLLQKKKFMGEYYLGSRSLGPVALTLSYGATSASAGSFVGFPALVYTHGWIVGLWIASYMIVPLCGIGLLGKRINQLSRKTGAITLPDLLRERFESRASGILSGGVIIFMLTLYLVPQFKTAGIILDKLMSGVPAYAGARGSLAAVLQDMPVLSHLNAGYVLCLGVFALVVIAYTTLGGFRAVVWTDVLQGFVMVFGVIFMLVVALFVVGGLGNATEKMARMTPPRLGTMAFEAEREGPERRRVPALTWVRVDGRLFRTNGEAVVAPGRTRSNEVKVVEITSPEEIADITGRPGFRAHGGPALAPVIGEMRDYASGAGRRGVYVTGPGPRAATADGFLPFGLAVSFFFFWALSGAGQPGNMVRLMAADSSRTLRRSMAGLSVYYALIYFPIVVIFCCARVILPGLEEDPDRIMPEMAFTLADAASMPWLAGLLVAAPFAAAMSTVDSFMLMISSSVVRDIYQRNINPEASERRIRRLGILVTLAVGLLVALASVDPPKFLQYLIVFVGGGQAVAFLVPVVLALYWPRFNTAGLLASMGTGLGVYVGLYLAGVDLFLHPLIWGFAASFGAGIATSLATRPPPERLVRKFFSEGGGDV